MKNKLNSKKQCCDILGKELDSDKKWFKSKKVNGGAMVCKPKLTK